MLKKCSKWVIETENSFVFDTTESLYLLITIPINQSQSKAIDSILSKRLKRTIYDYAFVGMRYASAAYEVLSSAHIYPQLSYSRMKLKYFYPKLLRKRLLKEAKKKKWTIFYREGKKSRKWEKD